MTICPNLSDDQVKMAFAKFDTSGDDKLDYREFCEMIRQKVEKYFLFLMSGIFTTSGDGESWLIDFVRAFECIILSIIP